MRSTVLFALVTVAACAPDGVDTSVKPSEVAISNGIGDNSLTTNSLWNNSLWNNSLWNNSLWNNSLWNNSLWNNSLWNNSLWNNNLRDVLHTNPHAREVLKYVYECAMPTGYSTTLVAAEGDEVTLHGAIGLGINADDTAWWDENGYCDESCQRWVSACVLARTNAYGVKVRISMRAPADAPQRIKDALALVDTETEHELIDFPLREGAFYGNLFQTAEGQTAGSIVQTPSFYACAGPGSNIPEITKRFCSSQGDNSVIKVPGVCTSTPAKSTDVCAGLDETGSIHDCKADDVTYKEVITVYLHDLIAVCGNSVCESTESESSCPSDCHPGSWGKTFTQTFREQTMAAFGHYLSSAVGPDGSVVMAGTANAAPVDYGGGPLTGGTFGIVKLAQNGAYLWGRRFDPAIPVHNVRGVYTQADGTIVVVGSSVGGLGVNSVWLGKLDAAGTMLPGWPITLNSTGSVIGSIELAIDNQANILLSTNFWDTITFATQPPVQYTSTNTTSGDTFVAKVSPSGALVWVRHLGPGTSQSPGSLAVDPIGDVVLARSAGPNNPVARLEKLSASNGARLWNVDTPPAPNQALQYCGLVTDGDGDLYTIGIGPQGDFLTKLAANDGSQIWSEIQPLYRPSNVCAGVYDRITLASDGTVVTGIVFGGSYSPLVDLGAGTFNSYATPDILVAAYAPDDVLPTGTSRFRWAKHIPLVLNGHFDGMHVAPDGHVVVSGVYSGSTVVDSQLFVNDDAQEPDHGNTFLASFNAPPSTDTTPPVMDHVPVSFTKQATGVLTEVFFTPPTAVDSAAAGVNVSCDPAPFAKLAIGAHVVTCVATDTKGNTATTSFTITLVDHLGPVLVDMPAPASVEATSAAGAVVTYASPTAIDQVDGAQPVACTPASGSTFPIGDTTVTCTSADTRGNVTNETFVVSIGDHTPPAIAVPTSPVISQLAIVTYQVTATDLIDGPVTSSCTPASGSTFPLGSTIVQCSATDSAQNAANASFEVYVEGDETPPILLLPDSVVVEATGPGGAIVTYSASSIDAVDGPGGALCFLPSGSQFVVGTTMVSCTATDRADNTASGGFPIVVRDATPPVVIVPPNITAEATSPVGATVSFTVTALDLVDGNIAAQCTRVSGSTFSFGSTTIECSATDAAGNEGVRSFVVNVVDTTGPVITVPANKTVQATGPGGAAVTFVVSAIDAVDGNVVPQCSRTSGSTFALGSTTVTCTASDSRGNPATPRQFVVTVVDTTPPVVTVPSNMTLEATSAAGRVVTFSSSAVDVVSGSRPTTCTPASGSTFAITATTVTCTATDAAGNVGTRSFVVTIRDTTPPVVTVPANMTVEATSAAGRVVTFASSAVDVVGGNRPTSCSRPSGSVFPLGSTTVTCTATDAAGNVGSRSFVVTVVDTTPPVLTVHGNVAATANTATGRVVTYTVPATDLVDGVIATTCTPPSGSMFPLGITTVTCTAQDSHGNSASASFLVRVTFAWSGILQPINADDSSIFRLKSTVPVKFRLTGDSAVVTNANATLTLVKLTSTISGTVIEQTLNVTPDTGNTFDFESGTYVFNLGTKNLSVGTWELRIDLHDGVARNAHISLRI